MAVGDEPPNLLLASPLNLSLKMFVFFRFGPDHLGSSTRNDRSENLKGKAWPTVLLLKGCDREALYQLIRHVSLQAYRVLSWATVVPGQTPERTDVMKKESLQEAYN